MKSGWRMGSSAFNMITDRTTMISAAATWMTLARRSRATRRGGRSGSVSRREKGADDKANRKGDARGAERLALDF